jgi:hypothetical protein
MARGIHGLPKVSPGPAMPDPSTPCGTGRMGGLRPSSTPMDTPRRTGLGRGIHAYTTDRLPPEGNSIGSRYFLGLIPNKLTSWVYGKWWPWTP